MLGLRRSWAVALALVGCGGGAARPPEHATQPPPPRTDPVVEAPDLSPVPRPATVFVVGRLKRPTKLADTVAHWAGVPLGLRDLVPFAKDLDSALAWDAPVEIAVALAPSGRRGVVESAFSIGLTGTEAALGVARAQGYEVKRLGPEIYAVGGTKRLTCAIAPAVGPTSARLVCAQRSHELEDLLPYMTRGLPSEAIGQHDLEIELKGEPVRQRYASEIGSARLFAGLAVRELSVDAPRFDRALSDAAYATADELVALAHDIDVLRIQGNVDEQKKVIEGDASVTLIDNKSFVARVITDNAQHVGPAPEKFDALPGDAEAAGYAGGHDAHLYDALRPGLLELADSYLEHEKIGKATRERVGRLLQLYLGLDSATVNAEGSGSAAEGAKPASDGSWMVMRFESKDPLWQSAIQDLAAVLGDRELRALLVTRAKTEDKSLPTVRLVPLRGPGIPAGARALSLSFPKGVNKLVARSLGMGSKGDSVMDRTIAIVQVGNDVVGGLAENPKELARRISQVLAPKGSTLATRADLVPMRSFRAHAGVFTTLARFVASFGRLEASTSSLVAGLPHHGQVPMFFQLLAEGGARPTGALHMTVPAGVFEDLPGLIPILAASFMKGLPGDD